MSLNHSVGGFQDAMLGFRVGDDSTDDGDGDDGVEGISLEGGVGGKGFC